jgi:hypothetical protein
MKVQKFVVVAMVVCLLMALAVGLSQAQSPTGPLPPNTDGKQNEKATTNAAKPAAALGLSGDLGPGFYYQGTLTEGGVPVSGVRQMEFMLFDAASGGSQIGGTIAQDVTVRKGQFSVILGWGSYPIDGRALWLAVQAKDSGGVWRDLGLQQILAVPYAMSLIPGAQINAQTSYDGIYVSGIWDGVHAQSSVSDGNHGAIYARATSATDQAIAGNFATYSPDGFGVVGTNESTGVGVASFQSGYSLADQSGYWRPGALFGGRNGAMSITKEPNGYALIAWSQATTGGGEAIEAQCASPNCWAGYFGSNGNGVQISTPSGKTGLSVSGGSKNAVVATASGSRLLYTEESTEVWFTDYGFGKLANGTASVGIDPVFAQTVNLQEPYHVFVQAYGDAEIYVIDRTPTGFEVRLRSGDANVEFSYRLVAKRAGFEGQRLERAPWADNDPNLYPEKAGAVGSMKQPGARTP